MCEKYLREGLDKIVENSLARAEHHINKADKISDPECLAASLMGYGLGMKSIIYDLIGLIGEDEGDENNV